MKHFRLEDADKWLNSVTKGMREAGERGLLSAAHRTVSHIQNEVMQNNDPVPVDRGIYRAAWKAEASEGGAVVYNDSPYAAHIEYGVRAIAIHPGRKMIDALVEWIKRKGIGGTMTTTSSGRSKKTKATTTEATRIAFAIVKSMQVKGIFTSVGLGIFQRAQRMIPQFIREEVTRELKKEFR